MIEQLLRPGLLRRLVSRTVAWSAIALLAFALAAFFVSNQLIVSRFEDEAKSLAANGSRGVSDRVSLASNAAAFLSEVKRIIETRVWTQDVQSELEKKHGGHEATQARLDRHRPHGIHDGRVAGS